MFLDLGEKINDQPSILAQREIIQKTVAKLLRCQVDVWFSKHIYHLPGTHDLRPFPKYPQTPLSVEALETRTAQVENASGEIKLYRRNNAHCAAIAIPMITQGVLTGILEARRDPGGEFDSEDINYLMGAAAHAAMALHVCHRSLINTWRLEQLGLIRSVSEQIANIHNLDELCQKVTQSIITTFHFYAVSIFSHEPEQNLLTFRSTAVQRENGSIENLNSPIFQVLMDRGIIGTVARSGEEILANDVEKEPRFISIDTLPLTRAEVSLPLKIDEEVVGVLDIQSSQADVFHEYDMLVLRSLADNIALAMEGARLYCGLQRRMDQIEAVAEVGRAVSSILDLDRLLNELVDLIRARFGYSFVHLFLMQAEKTSLIYRAGSGERSKILQKQGLSYQVNDECGIIPWVARNSLTWIANDINHDPHYRPSELPPAVTQSEMAVPIIFGEEVLGVLDVQSDEMNAFDEDDRSIFEALADTVAVAIRNATLYHSEKWRRQVAESLREVAGLLSANIATNQVLDAILTEVEKILPCDVSAIWLLDDPDKPGNQDDPHLTLAAVHGVDAEKVVKAQQQQPEVAAWIKKAIKLKEPNIRQSDDPYGPLGAAGQFAISYSSIAAPLHVGEIPMGLLTLAHHEPGRYGFESRGMTKAFASYAAVSIQNARLYEKAQEQAWVSTVLLQVAEATQSLTDLDELVAAVTRLSPMLVGVKGCAIYLWDEREQEYSLLDEYGLDRCFLQIDPHQMPAFKNLAKAGQPVFIHNIVDELFDDPPEMPVDFEQTGTLLLIPMTAHDNVQGVFLVEYEGKDQGDVLAEEKLSILQGIAHQTVLAIENIRLLEEQQQETYISASLLQVAQTIVTYNDLGDILESIVYLIPVLAGSDACLIYLWNQDHQTYYLSHESGLNKEMAADMRGVVYPEGKCHLFDTIEKDDQPVVLSLSSIGGDFRRFMELDPKNSIQLPSVMHENEELLIAFPLSVKGEVYGVLMVKDPGNQPIYLDKRIEIIRGIAQQTALAILNDRLQREMVGRETLEREFQLAREIQQTFLPNKIPQIDGWDLDARWRPARRVGGDFYDLFYLPGHKLGITIADISDKGVSAALYMTLTRTLMRAVVQEQRTASATLEKVNDLLLSDTPHGVFVTTLMGILDLRTGTFHYANAGHNLPVLRRSPDGEILFLEKGEMAMGVLEHVQYTEHTVEIQPGDMVVFYTDGIPDALNHDQVSFGMERFIDVIRNVKNDGATQLLDAIDETLIVYSGSQIPTDDVTLIGLKRLLPG
jgi:serine phosphatase RsbU (regulator of sigma subunit)/putative methionine-R-sulfoxide reductase with GAF domain